MDNKLSVLIISKNEEDVIADCIDSASELGEIVLVDGGSTDKTSEIARERGVKVIQNSFKDFSSQRNLAASIAQNQWIFYIDSDERVTKEFVKELREKIANEGQNDEVGGFYVKRKTHYYGKDWHFEDRVQRVFKKTKLKRWQGVVHETPIVDGKLLEITEPILHYTHRNLEQMVSKTNEWSDFEADLRFKNKHPMMGIWRFPRVMMTAFFKSYINDKGYRNGTAGVVEAIYQAFSMFITYAKLWEKQQEATSRTRT